MILTTKDTKKDHMSQALPVFSSFVIFVSL